MTTIGPARAATGYATATAPSSLFLTGIAAGVITGAVEIGVMAVEALARRRFLFLPREAVWMAPAAAVATFAIPAAGFALLARIRPSPGLRRAAAAGYALLGCGSVLLWYPQLHWSSRLLLAAGIAARVASRTSSAWPAVARAARRVAVVGVTATLGLALAMAGWRLRTERRALAGLPPAAAGAPNVLLIVLDTVRALNWSLHGYARETTPRLDGWARTGTRFTTALATASWTLPSHASLFTGRFAHELSADWMRPLDRRWPTLAETLAARGYATAGFTANLGYTSRETGVHRGFARYEDYPISVRWTLNCSGLGRTITRSRSVQRLLRRGLGLAGSVKDADQVNAAFLRWLDRRPARRPFFAFLNYIDVHDHLISPTFAGKFGADWGKQPDHRPGARWTEAEARWRVDRYDESLARLDAKVGALLDSLAARGLTEATLVIVTADHGEEFGEHGVISHGHTLYRPSVHVPLVFVRPGQVPAGRAVEMPVSLRDLPATIMDLVGGGEPHPFPGRSLAALWRDPQAADPARPIASTIRRVANQVPWYPASVGDLHAVVLGDLRYIVNVGSRREELYRMTADPLERHDLSATPEGAAALPRFRRVLAALLGTPAAAGRRAQGE